MEKSALARLVTFGVAIALFIDCASGLRAGEPPHVAADSPVAAGRFLVRFGGCNDCHTPGYARSGGKVPEALWLTGNPAGYHGRWGTTYAANLRLTVAKMSPDSWLQMAATRNASPPMPWPNLHALSRSDALALYTYIRSLGVRGGPTPPDVLVRKR